MKLKRIPFALAATIALSPLSAQQKQPRPEQSADPFAPGAAPLAVVPESEDRFDVDFIETPVIDACEYVADAVEHLTGQPINIVVSRDARDIVLPTMKLRQITFEQFVSFINRIGGANTLRMSGGPQAPGSMFDAGGGGGPPIPHTGPFFGITETDGIWYFWAEEAQEEKLQVPVKLTTRVFPLDGDTEAVLGLIEEALSESRQHGDSPEPTLKFHEPSGTLIATGNQEDLTLIEEVVMAMESRDVKLQEAKAEKARQVSEIRQMEQELSELLDRVEATHPSVISIRKRLDRAVAAQDQNE